MYIIKIVFLISLLSCLGCNQQDYLIEKKAYINKCSEIDPKIIDWNLIEDINFTTLSPSEGTLYKFEGYSSQKKSDKEISYSVFSPKNDLAAERMPDLLNWYGLILGKKTVLRIDIMEYVDKLASTKKRIASLVPYIRKDAKFPKKKILELIDRLAQAKSPKEFLDLYQNPCVNLSIYWLRQDLLLARNKQLIEKAEQNLAQGLQENKIDSPVNQNLISTLEKKYEEAKKRGEEVRKELFRLEELALKAEEGSPLRKKLFDDMEQYAMANRVLYYNIFMQHYYPKANSFEKMINSAKFIIDKRSANASKLSTSDEIWHHVFGKYFISEAMEIVKNRILVKKEI
jgi:hypothetical protein